MENWIFDRKSTAADLTKMVKILYYLKMCLNIFLATLFVPLIKKSFSTNFQAVFGKLNFWRKIHSRRPYKNGEDFVLSQNVLRKYFFAKFFVPLIKRSVSTNFKAGFGKLNFWQIHSRGPYKNGENFVLSQNVLRKYFLAKFFVPLIERSVSTNFKAIVKKIEFLTENPQPRTLQKWWKFSYYLKMC